MDMKSDMIEHIKKHPMWYGAGWIALLGVFAWLFQNWPGGFWGWLGNAWGWLRETPNGYESASTTIRNLGLVLAAPFVLWFAYWRAKVADRQAKAAQEQVATSLRQAETAQRGLLNERYQKGAEMLGSEVLSVRLGGIYALERLAREHPEEYHVQIMRLFCAFVRNPTPDDKLDTEVTSERTTIDEFLGSQEPDRLADLRLDIDAVMEAIALRSVEVIRLEKDADFHIDLREANLQNLFWTNFENVNLYRSNLSSADLSGASFRAGTNFSWIHAVRVILSDADLMDVNLSAACLWYVNLTGAFLINADLSRTILQNTNLSGADLRGARGLTQKQLDAAIANPDNPPQLDGVLDAETGEQLVWGGKPLNE